MRANYPPIKLLIASLVVLASLGPAVAARPTVDANTGLLTSYSANNDHANVSIHESVHVQMHFEKDEWTIHATHEGEGTATVTIEALEGSYEGEGSYEVDGRESILLPAPDEPVTLRITVETDHLTEVQVIEFVEESIECADTEFTVLRPILVNTEATVDGEQVYAYERADAQIEHELPEGVCDAERPEKPVIGDLPDINWSAEDVRAAYNWSHEQVRSGYEQGQGGADEWYNRTHGGAIDTYEGAHNSVVDAYEDSRETAHNTYEESRDSAHETYEDTTRDAWEHYHESYDFARQVSEDAQDDVETIHEDAEEDGERIKSDAEDDSERVKNDVEDDAETVREGVEEDGERIANDTQEDAAMITEDANEAARQANSGVEELVGDGEAATASAESETRAETDAYADASASYDDGSAGLDANVDVDVTVRSRTTVDSSHTPGLTADVSAVSQLKAQFTGHVSA